MEGYLGGRAFEEYGTGYDCWFGGVNVRAVLFCVGGSGSLVFTKEGGGGFGAKVVGGSAFRGFGHALLGAAARRVSGWGRRCSLFGAALSGRDSG